MTGIEIPEGELKLVWLNERRVLVRMPPQLTPKQEKWLEEESDRIITTAAIGKLKVAANNIKQKLDSKKIDEIRKIKLNKELEWVEKRIKELTQELQNKSRLMF